MAEGAIIVVVDRRHLKKLAQAYEGRHYLAWMQFIANATQKMEKKLYSNENLDENQKGGVCSLLAED